MNDENKGPGAPHPGCDDPEVETVSAYRDGDDLILIIDGVENRVPGGYLNASINEDGEISVYVHASFRASVIDMSATEPGS